MSSLSGFMYLHVFSREVFSLLTRGRARPVTHYVEERVGLCRISMPFFLRPQPTLGMSGEMEVHSLLENIAFPRRSMLSMSDRSMAMKKGKAPMGKKEHAKGEERKSARSGGK